MNCFEKVVGWKIECPLCGGPMALSYSRGPDGIEHLTWFCKVQGCNGQLDEFQVVLEEEEPRTCVSCGLERPEREMSLLIDGWCIDCAREEQIRRNVEAYERAVARGSSL